MKQIKRLAYMLCASSLFFSCGGNSNGFNDGNAIKELKKELEDKFGKEAYYTNFGVTNTDNGAVVSVVETKDPASMKMEEWNSLNGGWEKKSDVTIEVPKGVKPEQFMFQLNNKINFDLLAKLIDASKQKVITEKKIDEVKVESISIKSPDDGNFDKTNYFITITPKNGGTDFNFWYKLDGTLEKFE